MPNFFKATIIGGVLLVIMSLLMLAWVSLFPSKKETVITNLDVVPADQEIELEDPLVPDKIGPIYLVTAEDFGNNVDAPIYGWTNEEVPTINYHLTENEDGKVVIPVYFAGWSESMQGYLVTKVEKETKMPARGWYATDWEVDAVKVTAQGRLQVKVVQSAALWLTVGCIATIILGCVISMAAFDQYAHYVVRNNRKTI